MSFRFLTAGESHGKALIGILEGIPAGLDLDREWIDLQMKRRKLGYGRGSRQKIESDAVEILSGIRHGKSLGSPICLMIQNQDWQAWQNIMQAEPFAGQVKREVTIPRPGHADLIGGIKYQHQDMRNVLERSSARETAIRVGLGSVARKLLSELGISIGSRVIQIGSVLDSAPFDCEVSELNERVDLSPVRCLGKEAEEKIVHSIEVAKKEGNTLGGIFEVYASDLPLGLGSYAHWDRRLEGEIGKAFLSLNAIKGVEIGLGFEAAKRPGSQVHDEYFPNPQMSPTSKVSWRTNYSGGIDGGMSTGQPLVIRAAMKPLSTLMRPLSSVHLQTGDPALAHVERSDVCAVPAAAVIGESLLALVLVGAILEKFGGDSVSEIKHRVSDWTLHGI
jgi:chorismate synthase